MAGPFTGALKTAQGFVESDQARGLAQQKLDIEADELKHKKKIQEYNIASKLLPDAIKGKDAGFIDKLLSPINAYTGGSMTSEKILENPQQFEHETNALSEMVQKYGSKPEFQQQIADYAQSINLRYSGVPHITTAEIEAVKGVGTDIRGRIATEAKAGEKVATRTEAFKDDFRLLTNDAVSTAIRSMKFNQPDMAQRMFQAFADKKDIKAGMESASQSMTPEQFREFENKIADYVSRYGTDEEVKEFRRRKARFTESPEGADATAGAFIDRTLNK